MQHFTFQEPGNGLQADVWCGAHSSFIGVKDSGLKRSRKHQGHHASVRMGSTRSMLRRASVALRLDTHEGGCLAPTALHSFPFSASIVTFSLITGRPYRALRNLPVLSLLLSESQHFYRAVRAVAEGFRLECHSCIG